MQSIKESLLSNAGLGKRSQIENWLKEMGIKHYTINSNLTIDVKGPVNLCHRRLQKLPEYIQFNEIDGNFDISHNQLESLRGCPKTVTQNFWCNFNKLENLIGSPEEIFGVFNCSMNPLDTLEGGPKQVSGNYACSHCGLFSLKGISEKLGAGIICIDNNLTTLDDIKLPKAINGNFKISDNPLNSLKGCPTSIYGDFYAENINFKKLRYFPKIISHNIYLSKNSGFTINDIVKICACNPNNIYMV